MFALMENVHDRDGRTFCDSSGKQSYASEKTAQTVLNWYRKRVDGRGNRFRKDERPVRTYHCEECMGWHLTSRVNKDM